VFSALVQAKYFGMPGEISGGEETAITILCEENEAIAEQVQNQSFGLYLPEKSG
jgi:hypothetical protein